MLDPYKIREDFPILKRKINNNPLIYFDNAATTQKPKQVIEAIKNFYENHNANVHRAVYTL
ncbi:MAG: aminotransferase class V-fold PLP-dependent enzyme, partial [Candidatus Bathyarchaeia archaeon]